jgi:SsrA-binding protein
VGRRQPDPNVIVRNRAAAFHYEITEKLEAGIVLKGSEVKSLRAGGASLVEAYATIERGEAWIKQMHIAACVSARAFPHAEFGTRKLLLHAKEIQHLERAVMREGYTLVPLDLYFKNGRVKVTLGVGRGRKSHDKRAIIRERTEMREALQAMRRGTR